MQSAINLILNLPPPSTVLVTPKRSRGPKHWPWCFPLTCKSFACQDLNMANANGAWMQFEPHTKSKEDGSLSWNAKLLIPPSHVDWSPWITTQIREEPSSAPKILICSGGIRRDVDNTSINFSRTSRPIQWFRKLDGCLGMHQSFLWKWLKLRWFIHSSEWNLRVRHLWNLQIPEVSVLANSGKDQLESLVHGLFSLPTVLKKLQFPSVHCTTSAFPTSGNLHLDVHHRHLTNLLRNALEHQLQVEHHILQKAIVQGLQLHPVEKDLAWMLKVLLIPSGQLYYQIWSMLIPSPTLPFFDKTSLLILRL